MEFEDLTQKQLNELELRVRELLTTMRKLKLRNEPVAATLTALEAELGQARRERFDEKNTEYHTY